MSDRRSDVSGKVFLITGTSSGIGRVAAERLAAMGGTVVMVCRSRGNCEEVRKNIVERTGNPRVDVLVADLCSQRQIRRLAGVFSDQYDRLDALIHNAGVFSRKRQVTPEGFELQFAVNYIAPFLLTGLLFETLKASAPSRVVLVGSEVHRRGRIDFRDLQGQRSYSGSRAYAQSKLAGLVLMRELSRRFRGTGITVNALHPGAVATKLLFEAFPLMRLARPFLRTPEQGAETVVYLATSPEVTGVSGQYFIDKTPTEPARQVSDPEIARELWEVSMELTKEAGASGGPFSALLPHGAGPGPDRWTTPSPPGGPTL